MKTQLQMEHSFLITEALLPKSIKLSDIPYMVRKSIQAELKRQDPGKKLIRGQVHALASMFEFIKCRNGVSFWKKIAAEYPLIELDHEKNS